MTGSSHFKEDAYHVPVLCKAVLEDLITDRAGIYVDGTVGGGGHAKAIPRFAFDRMLDERQRSR